jgi:hypothetical protein
LTLSKRKEQLFSVGLFRSGKTVLLIGTASLFIVLSYWKNSSGPMAVCLDIVRNGSINFLIIWLQVTCLSKLTGLMLSLDALPRAQ